MSAPKIREYQPMGDEIWTEGSCTRSVDIAGLAMLSQALTQTFLEQDQSALS